MTQACNTELQGDKFIALRVRGPSFSTIREFYLNSYGDINDPAQFLYELFSWRFLAFGQPPLIRELHGSTSAADTMRQV